MFTRILLILAAIVLCGPVSQFILQANSFSKSFRAERMAQMGREADEVNRLFARLQERVTGESVDYQTAYLHAQGFQDSVNAITGIDSAHIWLIDSRGALIQSYGQDDEINGAANEFLENLQPSIGAALSGKTVRSSAAYNLSGRNTAVLTYGRPLEYQDKVIGAVFIHVREQQVQENMRSLFGRLWIGILLPIAALLFFGGVYSRMIVRPVVQLSVLAKKVSTGDFSARAKAKGRGEIADLERNFNTMVKELGELEQSRRAFIANVSHELRSPLTAIKGFIQGMQDGTIPSDEHGKYREIVLNETARLSTMITELLALSMMDDGKAQLNFSDFNVNELLIRMLLTFESRITEKNIEIDIRADEVVLVRADYDRIAQVVTNLIDNAVKFTPQYGRIIVESSVKRSRVFVSVSNTGERIGEADIKKIFERFYRADDSARTPGTGTGLGLSICQKIIELHHQRIMVKSNEELTSFRFTLSKAESARTKSEPISQ